MTVTKRTLPLVSLLLCTWVAASSAHAAGSVSLSPAVVSLRGEAGQSTTQTLTFTNSTSAPLSFEMVAMDVVVKNGKRTFVDAGATSGSIAATAVYTQHTATVAPGRSIDVGVTVTIPPQPTMRAIVVMCKGTTRLARGPMFTTASVGTLLTFELSSDAIAAVASPLQVQAPTASTNLVASQELTSTGSAPFMASGMLAILDSRGALVGKQAIPSTRLLPGEKTDLRIEYAGDLPSGRYQAMMTFDLSGKPLTSRTEFIVP
ncbi:MAG: hypothetical protein ABI779_08750 [Acidobacteriota bacterium]